MSFSSLIDHDHGPLSVLRRQEIRGELHAALTTLKNELRVELAEVHEKNTALRLELEVKNVMLENKNEALRHELEDLRGLLQSQPRRTDEEREQMPFLDCINTDDSDADNIYFDGCNVHVRSGGGSTDATPNGKGNIIIGYNKPRDSLMEVPESAEGNCTKTIAHALLWYNFGTILIGSD